MGIKKKIQNMAQNKINNLTGGLGIDKLTGNLGGLDELGQIGSNMPETPSQSLSNSSQVPRAAKAKRVPRVARAPRIKKQK